MKRTVFFLSDGTGITAETLGHALLSQFDNLEYKQITIPFVRDVEHAEQAAREIETAGRADGQRPIVFSTLTDHAVHDAVKASEALVLDLFSAFGGALEAEFNRGSAHATGRFHALLDKDTYDVRIDAVDFSLKHDDGAMTKGYDEADIIVVGVSRSGKTPTCLYLSMQFGIRAANFPITAEDLDYGRLPRLLASHRERLFGLTINPERLQQIRSERRPNSAYASLHQCRREVREVEAMLKSNGVQYIDTSNSSIEEIASSVLQLTGLRRRLLA